jgi:hypothetical protein
MIARVADAVLEGRGPAGKGLEEEMLEKAAQDEDAKEEAPVGEAEERQAL